MNCFEWWMKKFRVSFTLVETVTDNLLISLTKPRSHPWIAGHYADTTINQALFHIFIGGRGRHIGNLIFGWYSKEVKISKIHFKGHNRLVNNFSRQKSQYTVLQFAVFFSFLTCISLIYISSLEGSSWERGKGIGFQSALEYPQIHLIVY